MPPRTPLQTATPPSPQQDAPLAIYVHWPWCKAKCPYCDFNSHASAPQEASYIEALTKELRGWRNALQHGLPGRAPALPGTPAPRRIGSIFFGGGTPSLMGAASLARILAACGEIGTVDDATEITVECNPSSFGDERPAVRMFAEMKAAGVTRVSVGIQGLEPAWLAFLGRAHRVEDALATLDAAQNVFKDVNADVIYGLPKQQLTAWQNQLERLAGRGLQHISAYQLTVEPNTRFYKDVKDGLWQPVDGDTEADFHETTHQTLTRAGYLAYETSNFALPGHECRHNRHVWRYGDYLGVGAGAHGRVNLGGTRLATVVVRQPEGYLRRLADGNEAFAEVLEVDAVTATQEALFLGLRLTEGVNLERLIKLHGMPVYEAAVNAVEQAVLTEANLLEVVDGHLRTTPAGAPRLNAVLHRLLRPLPTPAPLAGTVFGAAETTPTPADSVYTAHTRVRFE